MSEARAITNVIGNGVASIVIAISEKAFDWSNTNWPLTLTMMQRALIKC